jgi:S-adenosylmethionine:tRNA ribosyltransferase-isomerase
VTAVAGALHALATRLLLIDTRSDEIDEGQTTLIPQLLDARDLLVVNDAATLPASLAGLTARGEPVEIRLLEGPYQETTRAVLLGRGDYHTRTELRAPPPALASGDTITVGPGTLQICAVSSLSPRLVELRWPLDLAARFVLLYRAGRPVQYSYIEQPLALWDVQTKFAARPWAVEMPSAARPLTGALLLALATRGVQIATLTHAAGLSSSGDATLDAALPLPERYDIPRATVRRIESTRARGGRVIAVGTSVVRALEDSALRHGVVRAGVASAELILDQGTTPRVVSGLLTGIHVPGESHYKLLSAFTRATTLARAAALAESHGYLMHEFGDAALFLPDLLSPGRSATRAA